MRTEQSSLPKGRTLLRTFDSAGNLTGIAIVDGDAPELTKRGRRGTTATAAAFKRFIPLALPTTETADPLASNGLRD